MIRIEGVDELNRRRKSAIERVDGFDWLRIARDLDQQGNALVEQLLSPGGVSGHRRSLLERSSWPFCCPIPVLISPVASSS